MNCPFLSSKAMQYSKDSSSGGRDVDCNTHKRYCYRDELPCKTPLISLAVRYIVGDFSRPKRRCRICAVLMGLRFIGREGRSTTYAACTREHRFSCRSWLSRFRGITPLLNLLRFIPFQLIVVFSADDDAAISGGTRCVGRPTET